MPAKDLAPAFRITVNGKTVPADVPMLVNRLSVVSEPDTIDHFSLTLTNHYPELRWTNSADADLFREGHEIKVQMGYADKLNPVFDGEITRISPNFPEGGTPTLEVEGYNLLHRLNGGTKIRTFQEMTDDQIAESIARDNGLSAAADATKTTFPYLIQHNQTDLAFLLERAGRIRFEVLVQGKKLYFRRAPEKHGKSLTLVWGENLKSFTATRNALRPVNEVIVRGYDMKTKEPVVGKSAGGDEDTKLGGSKTGTAVASQAFPKKQQICVNAPVASQQEADQMAHALFNERSMQFVTGSGSAIGTPALLAGEVIELQGLGKHFNGLYYVSQSTHTMDASGYVTSFRVRRNSTS